MVFILKYIVCERMDWLVDQEENHELLYKSSLAYTSFNPLLFVELVMVQTNHSIPLGWPWKGKSTRHELDAY